MVWIYFIKNKSDVFTKFIEVKEMVENQCNRKIKMLQSDGGTRYMSNEFDKFLKENGIIRQVTSRYTSQMNVVERKNKHTTRAMLFEANLSKRFLVDAYHYAVTLIIECQQS